jgi:hypothetical protein
VINKNVEVVRSLIQNLSVEDLAKPQVVADLIRAFGIVQWGPAVFGDEERFKNQFTEMAGIYQTPPQMAAALVYLSKFKIETYCEIGVFQGGNFIFVTEYLKRFNPELQGVALDPTDFLNPQIKQIIDTEPHLSFLANTSKRIEGWKFDLCMIDGDHSEFWVNEDWNNLGKFAKICMIHDINENSCPAVRMFWNSIKKGQWAEFVSPLPLQGIGIIVNEEKK